MEYPRVLAGIALAAFALTAEPVTAHAAQAPDTTTAAKTKHKSKKATTTDSANPATPTPAGTAQAPAAPKTASKTPARCRQCIRERHRGGEIIRQSVGQHRQRRLSQKRPLVRKDETRQIYV